MLHAQKHMTTRQPLASFLLSHHFSIRSRASHVTLCRGRHYSDGLLLLFTKRAKMRAALILRTLGHTTYFLREPTSIPPARSFQEQRFNSLFLLAGNPIIKSHSILSGVCLVATNRAYNIHPQRIAPHLLAISFQEQRFNSLFLFEWQ